MPFQDGPYHEQAQSGSAFGFLGGKAGLEKPGDLEPALKEALNTRGPVVIDAVTDHRAFAQRTWTGTAAAGH